MQEGSLIFKFVQISLLILIAILAFFLAPFIGLIAAPFFALKALPKWIAYRTLYKNTLTNNTRSKFGRIKGQDYTRWDGKPVEKTGLKPYWRDRMYEKIGEYPHGAPDIYRDNIELPSDYPFQTHEDLEWLNKELIRRKQKDFLDYSLRMLRASSKAIIPFFGLIWVVLTETGLGGAVELGCRGFSNHDMMTYWEWESAIGFHQENLKKRLK